MANLGPPTMSEFFADIDKLENLVLNDQMSAAQLGGKMTSKKKSPSQTYIEYLRLQKQNYDNPADKPVGQAYKMVVDVVGMNPVWSKIPRFENVMIRKGLLNYASSTTPIKQKLIAQLKDKFGKFVKRSKGEEKEEKSGSRSSTLTINTGKLLKKTWDRNQITKNDQKPDGVQFKIENTYTPAAYEFLANMNLNNEQITSFMRLVDNEAPEIPYLLTFIRRDLTNNSTKFGTYKMHKRLTLKQMELLGKKTKELEGVSAFWEIYCMKLQGVHAGNLDTDLNFRGRYLAKLRKFISERPFITKCSGLRATILYNYMTHLELTTGKYDKQCLLNYLMIPRERRYNSTVIDGLLKKLPLCPYDFSIPDIPCLETIGNDEPFVTRALEDFFRSETESYPKWTHVVDTKWVKVLFTRTRLMNRQGNEGDLKKELLGEVDKYAFANLREKVDITLCPNNKTKYKVEDRVELDVWVKNVNELKVDVYELNPLEYYTKSCKELSLDLELDGLAPTSTKRINTRQADIIVRAKHTIKLTNIKNKNGVYLVELIGNGQRSRCLLRKGELRYVAKTVDIPGRGRCTDIVVLEDKKPVKLPRVWVGRKCYESDEKGHVVCDYNQDSEGVTPFVVEDQSKPGSATLHYIEFPRSQYALRCGLYVDRESLLARQTAKCLVRPALFVDEEPCSIENFQNCKLTLTCTTVTETLTKVISPVLRDDREFVYELTVPNELRTLEMKLQGCVQRQGKGPMIQLENVEKFTVNLVDNEKYLGDLHLIPKGVDGYVLAAYGKNGEPYANQLVKVWLEHRYFQRPLFYTLETNEAGVILLGRLPDVKKIRAQSVQGAMYPNEHMWELLEDKVNVPAVVNIVEKGVVRIPFMSSDNKGPKIDIYDAKYILKYKSVTYKDGYVEIRGLPVGDFVAHVRDIQCIDVIISVGTGAKVKAGGFDFIVSNSRVVELSEDMPLQIIQIKGNREQGYRCQLQGFGADTRVHIVSTHLVPRYTSFSALACPMVKPNVSDIVEVWNEYGMQMDLAEEFVYVSARRVNLGKRGGDKLGVQLPCPSVVQSAVTCNNPIKPELKKAPTPEPKEVPQSRQKGRYERIAETVLGADVRTTKDTCNLEWLAEPSMVIQNLTPDNMGWVQIPINNNIMNTQNLLQIIATDDNNISLRNVILPNVEATSKFKDCRLMDGLDPRAHLAEIREVMIKSKGDDMLIQNWETTQLETIDDISDVFELFLTIAGKQDERARAHLAGFHPMTIWNKLSHKERLAFYGGHKCNEINFWLYRKDPEFFDKVIRPLIAGKVQKDCMDYYLLGNLERLQDYTGSLWGTLNVLERVLVDSVLPREGTQERYDALIAESKNHASTISRLDELFRLTVESKNMARIREADLLKGLAEESKYEEDLKFDLTAVFEESRYWRVPFEETNASLLVPNDFWRDFATYMFTGARGPFLTTNYGYATTNLTEMLTALACLDLDYRSNVESLEPVKRYPNKSEAYILGQPVSVLFQTPTIVLSKQLKEVEWDQSALSVSTNYFDPFHTEAVVDGEVEDAFLDPTNLHTQKVYGCRVVVTNVSSQNYEVEVLTQIPTGAIPVMKGHKTRNQIVKLAPFQTTVVPYYFYFAAAGSFTHWPAHVNMNGKILGFDMKAQPIRVVDPRKIEDRSSWGYMCRDAEFGDLMSFIRNDVSLPKRDLTLLAPRGVSNLKQFKEICNVLRQRALYCPEFWRNAFNFGVDGRDEIEEYLNLDPDFQEYMYPTFGDAMRMDPKRPLASFDPLVRKSASYNEFWTASGIPGKNLKHITDRPKIGNFDATYHNYLLTALVNSYNLFSMSVEDRMCATYYMILMNRTSEATRIFNSIKNPPEGNQLYDYMNGFLTVHADATGLMSLSTLTSKYLKSDNIGPSLRAKWSALENFVGELRNCKDFDKEFVYESEESKRARSEVILALECEGLDRTIVYKNLENLVVKLYKIDIELMFSTAPFTRSNLSYRYVEPTKMHKRDLEKEAKVNRLQLTDITGEFKADGGENYIFEVISGDKCVNGSIYMNQLDVQLAENQLRVLRKTASTPVVKAYVKVYAQTNSNADGVFYKDGYTDLRGRFDYKTVATNALASVTRFGILVKTISNGSDVIYVTN